MIQFQTLLGKEEKSQTIPLNAVLPTKLMWPHQRCALFMLLTVTTLLENTYLYFIPCSLTGFLSMNYRKSSFEKRSSSGSPVYMQLHFCVQLNSKYKWMQWVGQLASRQLVVTFKIKLPASELCNRKVFIIWRSLVQTPQPSVAWSPREQNCLVTGLIGYQHFSKLRGFWMNFWILGSIFITLNNGRHGSKQKASVSHAIR